VSHRLHRRAHPVAVGARKAVAPAATVRAATVRAADVRVEAVRVEAVQEEAAEAAGPTIDEVGRARTAAAMIEVRGAVATVARHVRVVH
jgi:hypothetical protein